MEDQCDLWAAVPRDLNSTEYAVYQQFLINVVQWVCHFPSAFDGYVIYVMSFTHLTNFLVSVVAFYLVVKNKRSGAAVKTYQLSNLCCRLTRGICGFYYVSCLMTLHCINSIRYPWCGVFVNQIVSGFYSSNAISIQWYDHAVSFNRYFAVSFDGIYCKRVSKWKKTQCILFFVLPMCILLAPMGRRKIIYDMYTFSGYLFNINLYTVTIQPFGNAFDTLITIGNVFLFLMCVLAMFSDRITLKKVRQRVKEDQEERKQRRADIRLSIQMFFTHLVNVGYWILFFLHFFEPWLSFLTQIFPPKLVQYLSLDFVVIIENIIQGALMIYFNWGEKKENSNEPTIGSNSSNSPTLSDAYNNKIEPD